MNIPLKPVTSSSLAEVGYDPATQTLAVRFQPRVGAKVGDLWHYHGVPPEKHQAMLKAESVGKYFGAHIKPKFSARKIPADG